MHATYISSNSFSVLTNRTDEFITGRRVKCDCDTDGIVYANVVSATYTTVTTVVIDENSLTSNLKTVLYGIVEPGPNGSLPIHDHSDVEGMGGSGISFLYLSDTPSTYSGTEGLYLASTGSGIEWADVSTGSDSFLSLTDTPSLYDDGKYLISTISGLEWVSVSGAVYFGNGIPNESLGITGDVYIDRTNEVLYEKTTGYSGIATYTAELCTNSSNSFALSSYSGRTPDRAFDGAVGGYTTTTWNSATEDENYIGYSFDSPKIINKLRVASSSSLYERTPVAFQFRASNSAAPTNITEAQGGTLIYEVKMPGCQNYPNKKGYVTTYWSTSEWKTWWFDNNTAYSHYWLLIWDKDENYFSRGAEYLVSEIDMMSFVGYVGAGNSWKARLSVKKNFLELNDTPSTYSGTNGLYARSTGSGIEWGSITTSFLGLTGTPSSYDNGKYLKSTVSGTEWAEASAAANLIDLGDTPSTYNSGKYLRSTVFGTEWDDLVVTTVTGIILYGVGDPPNPSGYVDGTLFFRYVN
jgi:hypothetical protein